MVANEQIIEDYYHPDVVLALKIFESVFLIFVLSFMYHYCCILMSREFCHPNLRLMLLLQPLSCGFGISVRVCMHLMELLGLDSRFTVSLCRYFSDLGISIGAETMMMMAIERLYALRNVDTYEDDSSPRLGIYMGAILILFQAILLGLWDLGIIPTIVVYVSGYFWMFVTAGIFLVLPLVSMSAYKKVAMKRCSTVSQRFRTARNLKAARFLMFLSPYKFVTNIVLIMIYTLTYEIVDVKWQAMYSEIMFVYNEWQTLFQMLLTLNLHSTLRQEFRKLITFRKHRVGFIEVRSVQGSRMMFTVTEEQNMHFEALQYQWKTKLKEKHVFA